jgi:hypothetical protein
MKLYLLKQKGRYSYDEYDSKLVRAENETQARFVASLKPGDEGEATWLLDCYSSVEEVTQEGPSEQIIGSFNAG